MIFDPVNKTDCGIYATRVSTPKTLAKDIRPLFDLVDEAYEGGEKGAIYAQIQEGTIKAFFLPAKQAQKLSEFVEKLINEGALDD